VRNPEGAAKPGLVNPGESLPASSSAEGMETLERRQSREALHGPLRSYSEGERKLTRGPRHQLNLEPWRRKPESLRRVQTDLGPEEALNR
jgi:hypothetical protein